MSATLEIPVIVRTAPRDIRATRGEALAQRQSPHAHAAKFAQALLARLSVRTWPWTPQGLVLRQDRPVVAAHYVQQNSHTHFAPGLNLTVLAWQPGEANDVSEGPSLPVARVRVEQETHVLRALIHPIESTALERLVYRVIAQGQRVEAGATAVLTSLVPGPLAKPEAGTAALLSVPEMRPVQRVVRRIVSAETEPVASARTVAGSRVEEREANRSATTRQEPLNRVVDVNQLTDQVIKAIDHRIIAQRERLGRV